MTRVFLVVFLGGLIGFGGSELIKKAINDIQQRQRIERQQLPKATPATPTKYAQINAGNGLTPTYLTP